MARTWLSTDEATERLGVKPETLYAYVSRGLIRSERVPGQRRSRFLRSDVERHAERSRRGRRSGGLEIVVETAVCALDPDGHLAYRGHDVAGLCAAPAPRFESVATLLWTGDLRHVDVPDVPVGATPEVAGSGVDGREGTLVDRWRATLPAARVADPLRGDRRPEAVATAGRAILAALLAAAPRLGHEPRPDDRGAPPSVAARLWPRLTAAAPSDRRVAALDAALVLLADHELASSTLAARVTASTWADPYLVVLGGLAAVGGPLHGGAGARARLLLAEVADADDPERAASEVVGRYLADGAHLPGFGHSVYVGTDPRTAPLLGALDAAGDLPPAVPALLAVTRERRLPEPNIDLALAALALAHDMVPDATEAVFALARTVGWLAHATEEYEHRLRYRARAAYVGDRSPGASAPRDP